MKTKISLILLGLGLASGAAYAGTVAEPMPVSNDINVTAPDQSGMWSFGATAVLMQPTNKAFNYADEQIVDTSTNMMTAGSNHKFVDEGYHWWFGADISYAFPGSGRDVTLAYEGLHGTDTTHTSVPGPLGTSLQLSSSFSGNPYLTAEGETDTNYDAGDLLLGQKLDVGQRIRLHPFVGLRYAYINTKDTGYYTGGDSDFNQGTGPSDENAEIKNTFNGIGPRFGSDAQVNLGQGFSLRARLGLSALIGSRSTDVKGVLTAYAADGTTVEAVLNGFDNTDSATHVIPEIDGRLGLNYTYNLDSSLALGFEAGWQATNYFNVIADQFQSGGNNGGLGDNVEHYQENSNFGIQGPYARIQLDIA